MSSQAIGSITQDIISFLLETSNSRPEFRELLSQMAEDDPSGHTIRVNFQAGLIAGDEDHGVPVFHRLIVLKALTLHVDWEEIAEFFSGPNTTTTES